MHILKDPPFYRRTKHGRFIDEILYRTGIIFSLGNSLLWILK